MFWNGNLYLAPCSYYPISDTCKEASHLGASSPQAGSVVDSGRVADPLSGLNCPLKIPNSLYLFKIYFLIFLIFLKVKLLIPGSKSLALAISTVQWPIHVKKELQKEGKWRRRSGTEVSFSFSQHWMSLLKENWLVNNSGCHVSPNKELSHNPL